MKNTLCPRFFAGALTPSGFCSRFHELYSPERGDFCYILKGGPGTGKSTLMKRLCAEGTRLGDPPEIFLCSSDPESLDGVIFRRSGTVVADGTAPHVLEPSLPGVNEQLVNLGSGFNLELLQSRRREISELSDRCSSLHARAARYVRAAGALLDDAASITRAHTDEDKAAACGDALASRMLKAQNGISRTVRRYLSAVTPSGVLFLADTLNTMCDEIIVIDDRAGIAASALLRAAAARAERMGCDTILCPCSLSAEQRPEHLIIPSQRIGFTVANRYHRIESERRIIHASRFTDSRALIPHRERLAFDRKTASRLLSCAAEILSEANSVHRELEGHYIAATDFRESDKYFTLLRRRICG